MLIYIFTFVISILFFYLASKTNNTIGKACLIILAMIPTSLLASLRDLEIGTDIFVYGYDVWTSAVSSSTWHLFYSWYSDKGIEIGYLFLNYLVSRFSNDIHVFFFIHEFIIILLVVLTALKLKKSYLLWFMPLFFDIYMYNESLNILRQTIAIAFCLFFSTFLFQKKLIPYLIGCFICYNFHHSAAFMILMYPMIYLFDRFENKKVMLFILIIFGTVALLTSFQAVMNNLISGGFLVDKYEVYVGVAGNKSHKIDLVFLSSLAILMLLINKRNRLNPMFFYSFFFIVMSFSLILLGSLTEVANRVAYYMVFPLSYMMTESIKNNIIRSRLLLGFSLVLIIRYIYLAVVTGIAGTVPYHSMILDFIL